MEEENELEILSTGEELDAREKVKEKEKFIEAMNKYYKLKNEYEESIQNDKKNILKKMKGLSLKEKRIEYKKLKPKCINCKRPVGSIFENKVDEKEERHLIAMCGDRVQPCPLQIDIQMGYIIHLEDETVYEENKIKEHKKSVIIDKNDLLFGYITSQQAVDNFEKIKEDLETSVNNYELFMQFYNTVVDNSNRKKGVIELEEEVYATIDSMKQWMKEFDKTGNHKFVVDTVESYINTMIPKLRDLMKKKYMYSAVEYNEDEKKYILIQKKYAREYLEVNLGEDGEKVISMKMGTGKIQQKSKKPKFQKEDEEAEFVALEGGSRADTESFSQNQKINFNVEDNTDSSEDEMDVKTSTHSLDEIEYDSD